MLRTEQCVKHYTVKYYFDPIIDTLTEDFWTLKIFVKGSSYIALD